MGGGNSQYGSGGGMPMYRGGGYQPQNQNATFRNALNYGNQRLGMMPGFQGGQPGQYGRIGGQWGLQPQDGRYGTQPPPPNSGFAPQTGGGMPASEALNGGRPAGARSWGGRDYVYGEPDSPGQPPSSPTILPDGPINQPRTPVNLAPLSQTQSMLQNTASVAGFQMPQSLQSQPPQQPQTANSLPGIGQTPTAGGYANPWGFSQQQLGPSFNPGGSPRGGYFGNNMQYVPNVGNARNGLDDMARWGQNWDSQPFTRGPLIR